MADKRTKLSEEVESEVRSHFPTQTLQTVIPRSVRVSEAPSYGQSVITYDPNGAGSLAYRKAALELSLRLASRFISFFGRHFFGIQWSRESQEKDAVKIVF